MNSRSETASTGPLWDCTRWSILKHSTYYTYYFYRIPAGANEWISASYACSLGSFPAVELSCQVSIWQYLFYLIIFYFLIFGHYLLEACLFQMRDKRSGSGKKGI